jgi:hypothetical protein
MSWTLCTSGAIVKKAGINANSTAVASNALLVNFYDEAEAIVNTLTRKDWVANYSNVTTNFQKILASAVSSKAAMMVISYDMSGYTSRLEAQTMLDVLRDDFIQNIDSLKDEKNKEVMN